MSEDRLGHYVLRRRLGAGAMGEVWLADHELMRAPYAVKVLPAHLAGSAGFRDRFVGEARVMATLQHPHIVTIHFMGSEGDCFYIAMDFVSPDGEESRSLEELLSLRGGRLAPSEAARVLGRVCDAVAHAHSRGVIHRDLKPSNVLMGADGLPRVSDFGLAKVVGDEFLRSSIAASMSGSMGLEATRAGHVPGGAAMSMGAGATGTGQAGGSSAAYALVGTYHYMPPEVRDGAPWTIQGDVYSLGVLAYRMVTGRRPEGRWKNPTALVPGLPDWWDVLVERALEAEPGDRWECMADMRGVMEGRSEERRVGK